MFCFFVSGACNVPTPTLSVQMLDEKSELVQNFKKVHLSTVYIFPILELSQKSVLKYAPLSFGTYIGWFSICSVMLNE